MNDIIAAQRRYFNSGATRNTDFRRRMLARLEEAVRRHEAELLAALKKSPIPVESEEPNE